MKALRHLITSKGTVLVGADVPTGLPSDEVERLQSLGAITGEPKKPRGQKAAEYTDREKAIIDAIEGLTAEDLTADGKPEVDAINALIEGEPVTAAERDAVWAKRK